MLIAISVPADNERGPQYIEQMFDAVYRQRCRVSFEFGRHRDTVALYCRFADYLQETIEGQLRSAYPDARITEIPETALDPPENTRRYRLRLRLWFDVYGIKWWQRFQDREQRIVADPIGGILTTLAKENLYTHVAIATRSASLLRRTLFLLRRLLHRRREPEGQKPAGHLFTVSLRLTVAASARSRRLARRKLREIAAAFGGFENLPYTRLLRVAFWPCTFLLSTPELATLWHPPTDSVQTDRMETSSYRRLEPPSVLPTREREQGIAVLGRVAFHGRQDVFGIRLDDRRRHLQIIGKTGMGKSTLLENLAASDIAAGRGVAFIDPHGDSAKIVAASVPKHRTNDVVLFEPEDRSFPIAFNPLDCRAADERHLVASEIVAIFQKLYDIDPSNAPRLLDILRNAVMALMEVAGNDIAVAL